MRSTVFVIARAATYATLFIGFLLVFVPRQILGAAGITPPTEIGPMQWAGQVVLVAGGALALWCVLTFAFIGKGTPAPFDPPRKLVVRGPYRYARNPMYLGAALGLWGAGMYYDSGWLFAYVAVFLIAAHIFVVTYEEPTLTRLFGDDYEAYRARVSRWLPRP
jgi:protein-S-isoprenylcysteine O-methyltransferase Ste14